MVGDRSETAKPSGIDRFDGQEIYCRKLGHHLLFRYCRTTADGTLCSIIRDCWFEKLDIQSFLVEHFTPEELEEVFSPPPPKITSIVELIERARKR